MLDLLNRLANDDETLRVSYSKLRDGKVRLLIEPMLGEAPENLDEDAQQLRAALARPVVFTGPHADVVASFERFVDDGADARREVGDLYQEAVQSLKDAAKAGAAAKRDKVAGKGKADTAKSKTSAGEGKGSSRQADDKPAAEGQEKASASEGEEASAQGDADKAKAGAEQPTSLFD